MSSIIHALSELVIQGTFELFDISTTCNSGLASRDSDWTSSNNQKTYEEKPRRQHFQVSSGVIHNKIRQVVLETRKYQVLIKY